MKEGVKTSGVVETHKELQKINDFLKSRKPMENVTKNIRDDIKGLTKKGKDFSGRRFEAYSAKYARRKKSPKVNLELSGLMLRSMKTKALTPRHGSVYIEPHSYGGKTRARTDMIAQIHTTGTGVQPEREFLNITKSRLQNIIRKHYDDALMKLLGRR